MSFPKITQEDLANRGVTGLPDTPNYSTADMQRKFDELSLDVLVPKYNALVESLVATDAAANIGAKMPAVVGLESEDATIQTVLDTVAHLHNNKKTLDKLTEDADGTPLYDGKFLSGDAFASITVGGQSITATNTDNLTLIAGDNIVIDVDSTEKTVKFTSLGGGGTGGGGGDMFTAVYDKDKDGIVDNASALGGNPPSYYQSVESEDLNTTDKNIVNAINEVKETADEANAKEVDTLTTMEQVQAATDPTIPVGAGAVKEVSDSLGGIRIGYDETTQKYGYWKKEADTEVFVPFSNAENINLTELLNDNRQSISYTVTKDSTLMITSVTSGTSSVGGITVSTVNPQHILFDNIVMGYGNNYARLYQSIYSAVQGEVINISVPIAGYGTCKTIISEMD